MTSTSNITISKTTFLEFLQCSKNTWLKLHRPDLHKHFQLSEFEKHLLEQGNEVDSIARNLFPDGIEIVGTGQEACQETTRHMTSEVQSLFQATFIVDGFIARNDILVRNVETNKWDLYEVKGSNTLKEGSDRDYINDVTFQLSVLRRAHIAVGRMSIIHLNKDYVRQGKLVVEQLLEIEDVTDKVEARMSIMEAEMAAAKEYLLSDVEPSGECQCIYLGRNNHCTTFSYSNPQVPEYSIHDIARIGASKKKLSTLVERKIFDIADIPEDFDLSDIQRKQVQAHQTQNILADLQAVKNHIGQIVFPIYFLDYETFPPAIPIFDGYKPYQHIPFQLSLHILDAPNGELKHIEYLHNECTDPSMAIINVLRKNILDKGSIMVWNKTFEARVHRELGQRHQAHQAFLDALNNRLYDLMEVFQKQHYVHPKFFGSHSVKYVLPAIAPELRYGNLTIQEGGQASDAWWKMVSPATTTEVRQSINADLREYCGFDTYAMYVIWKHLREL